MIFSSHFSLQLLEKNVRSDNRERTKMSWEARILSAFLLSKLKKFNYFNLQS